MDAAVIAFLVLLGGTSAEHVIRMPSMDDCLRASETVAQAQCMDETEYAEHVAISGASPNSGASTVSGALMAPPPNAMQNFPSAAQRRVRNALNPVPTTPTTPVRRLAARKAAQGS
jgi:D-alanine-D-alanine ligase-like ATP-grasp enzyme